MKITVKSFDMDSPSMLRLDNTKYWWVESVTLWFYNNHHTTWQGYKQVITDYRYIPHAIKTGDGIILVCNELRVTLWSLKE